MYTFTSTQFRYAISIAFTITIIIHICIYIHTYISMHICYITNIEMVFDFDIIDFN